MTNALLEVRELSKSFGEISALDGVSFEIRQGEILGLVGPNGSGKSTLLRCMIGLLTPDCADIQAFGLDGIKDSLKLRAQLGYLPGDTSIYKHLRAREVVEFGLAFHDRVDHEVLALCHDAFPLPLEQFPAGFSAGMKQQLALIIALSPLVPLYLLDEPDKSLDASMRKRLLELLLELKKRGKSMLISSHHLDILDALSDRLLFLVDGKLVEEVEVREIRSKLERQLRCRLRKPVDKSLLPADSSMRQEGDTWIFERDPDKGMEELMEALLPFGVLSMEFGIATLQDIYKEIYAKKGSRIPGERAVVEGARR